MTAFFHHRSAVSASRSTASRARPQRRHDVLAEHVDERAAGLGRRGGSTRRRSPARRARRADRSATPGRTRRAPAGGRPPAARSWRPRRSARPARGPSTPAGRRRWSATGRGRRPRASSSVGAHDTCTCRYAGLPSPPLPRKASSTPRSASTSWLTVISPSAQLPTHAAVSAETAAPTSGGGVAGSVHSRARSTSTRPWWVTSSPANSARITSTHSLEALVAMRLVRPAIAGDVLVGRLAGAEGDPQPSGEHLRQAWPRPGRRSPGGSAAPAP